MNVRHHTVVRTTQYYNVIALKAENGTASNGEKFDVWKETEDRNVTNIGIVNIFRQIVVKQKYSCLLYTSRCV